MTKPGLSSIISNFKCEGLKHKIQVYVILSDFRKAFNLVKC